MAPYNRNISHAEIWDDSALVDSWNDALEEYKKYHSIKARGEDVEEVLRAAENHNNGLGQAIDHQEEQVEEVLVNDPRAKNDLPEETGDHDTKSAKDEAPVGDTQAKPGQAPNRTPPTLPQHMIGQGETSIRIQVFMGYAYVEPFNAVHDDGLKNLLMSWYYAGYYTGLYEGQQQGAATLAKHEA